MTTNKFPLVSIIIVNYNGRTLLENCFNSLAQVTYPNFEIILVDNNSTDDSIEFTKNNFPSTIIIKLEKNYGFSYPNNVGAKNAKGDLFLFLNNDTTVDPNFISEMIEILKKDPKIAICQSLLLKPDNEIDSSGDFIDSIGVSFSSKEKIEDVRTILSARGASMIIRKEIFEKLGGFDEKFYVSFEDVDIGWRAWILGYKVVVVPRSIVYHVGGQTIKNLKKEIQFHGLKNQISIKITNFESNLVIKNLIKFFVIYGLRELRIKLDYLFKGKTSLTATKYEEKIAQNINFSTILKSIIWIFKNSKYLRKKHRLVNSSRNMKTEDLIKLGIIAG